MPIYEYRCQDCGKVTEVFIRSINEKVDVSCPDCRSSNLLKIFSAPSAVLMGGLSKQGMTCCGRNERCDTPPCSDGGTCKRD
jgi:putative FmdB family regulatory protein